MIKHILNIPKIISHFIVTGVCLFPLAANAADIVVKVDRPNIQLNEAFTLTFESTSDVDDDPDLTPLETDFKILAQRTTSNFNLSNGNYTKILRWNISLMPLKQGTLKIPSINFGSDKSPEYTITVQAIRKSSGKTGEEFISELEVDQTSVYPQSQIIITQRMLSARTINAFEFSEPEFSGVEINMEPLGETNQYQTKRGDTSYLVLERHYAIYPQSAGKLTISPSIASARVEIANRSQFNSFRRNTKTVRRASADKTVTVRPVPSSFNGNHWLPAKEVQLVEEFPQNSQHSVGEPITRTLSLFVDGQTAAQLPEFKITNIDKIKQYPDKAVLNDNKSDSGITGGQQIKIALIPSQPGSYTLPEISIPWWNTTKDKLEYATSPARTFTVTTPLSPIEPIVPQQTIIEQLPETAIEPTNETKPVTDAGSSTDSLIWKFISLLLATGWFITLFILWKSKRSIHSASFESRPVKLNSKQAILKIQKACDESDAKACKTALLFWANIILDNKPVHSLGELSERVPAPLSDKLNSLNSHLYKDNANSWDCENMVELCENFTTSELHKNNASLNKSHLESLYR